MRLGVLMWVLVLGGCAAMTEPVVLKNPITGAVAQCGPYNNSAYQSGPSAIREQQCITDYRAQGFLRQ